MGEKKGLARTYVAQGLKRDHCLSILGLTRHQYYYRPTGGKPGRKPTSTTPLFENGVVIDAANDQIIEHIAEVKSYEDTDYGCRKMTYELNNSGYYINHKKVSRLMAEAALMHPRPKRKPKQYVRLRIVQPTGPLEVLEMDIKYVWIQEVNRHCYILTVIDTFTRKVLNRKVGFTMKATQVRQCWEEIVTNHLQPADLLRRGVRVEIRNDNGPQFCAKLIREFFATNHLVQLFTHPYTPEENGHIESFHGILSKILQRHPFWSLAELESRLDRFYHIYNHIRIHSSIAYLSPITFEQLWYQNKIETRQHKGRTRFRLMCERQKLNLSAYKSLKEAPLFQSKGLNAPQIEHLSSEKVSRPASQSQPSATQSPSVAPL